ncbi:MAG TPA: hypothetical protein VLK03_02890 [Nocardioides sp.]|nr:hypothetical protein [Nocardioides sp.]
MRPAAISAIAAGALAVTAAGCQQRSDAPRAPALELSCDDPAATDLGVPTIRRTARLTTSGGRHRFVVTSLPTGSILGDVEDTEVQVSDPGAPTEALFRVTTSPQQPGVVHVEAGTYVLLNTNRGGIEVEVCPDVTLSSVEPAAPPLEPRLQGTMTITPASATPGQEVALDFPADSVRGVAFSLATWAEGAWTPVYFLTSDWGVPAEHPPSWWRVEDSEDRGWEQVAVEGDGPDRVVVPDAATAGDYLLCTANAADEACALLTVTD